MSLSVSPKSPVSSSARAAERSASSDSSSTVTKELVVLGEWDAGLHARLRHDRHDDRGGAVLSSGGFCA
jgi:hypothetical protein